MLYIEYQYARSYVNSLALQAVFDRANAAKEKSGMRKDLLMNAAFERQSVDYDYIQEVVEGTRETLRKTQDLDRQGVLKYCPVRVFYNIASASILLLKATGLGTSPEDATRSLNLLSEVAQCMRRDPVDELHLVNRFATLIEKHVKMFKQRFLSVSTLPNATTNMDFSAQRNPTAAVNDRDFISPRLRQAHAPDAISSIPQQDIHNGPATSEWSSFATNGAQTNSEMDQWWCLPMNYFDLGDVEAGAQFGNGGLDFSTLEGPQT